jgi:hypothetical protein
MRNEDKANEEHEDDHWRKETIERPHRLDDCDKEQQPERRGRWDHPRAINFPLERLRLSCFPA